MSARDALRAKRRKRESIEDERLGFYAATLPRWPDDGRRFFYNWNTRTVSEGSEASPPGEATK